MCKYNFDEVINRYNTNSLKWDYAKRRNKPEDVLPLWVADMDFKCPNEVMGIIDPAPQYSIILSYIPNKSKAAPITTNKLVI